MFHRDQPIFQQISTAHRCSSATGGLGGLQLLLPCLPCFQFTSRTKVTEIAVDATGAAFVMPKPCTRLASFWMPRISSERIHQGWRDENICFFLCGRDDEFMCQDAALSLWRGLGAALMLLPRTWAIVCPDVNFSMLIEHVSSCIIHFRHFPMHSSKKFIQTHRNRGEEGRTIQASLNFLRVLLWFAYMAEQASQTQTALQLQRYL